MRQPNATERRHTVHVLIVVNKLRLLRFDPLSQPLV